MKSTYDVIIVGSGAAGLFAALEFPDTVSILMITKDKIENSDSYLAQGGICTLKDPEDFESFYQDTLKAGRYENNPESVKIMIDESPKITKQLVVYGVNFDTDENGNLAFTREGAHSTYRILHHQDVTGKAITSALIKEACIRKNIEIKEYTTMIDLCIENNCCHGIVVETKDGDIKQLTSKVTLLATGGIGGLFSHSTNFSHISGDSFALAIKHHIELENINYIQIHPTTLYTKKPGRSFLISESVRGEGAILLNPDLKRFVDELQPRDVVSNAILEEMKKYHTDHVYLSLCHMPKEQILHRFPNIYQKCVEEGYDVFTEPIPITPAQHYLMGGIKTDTRGRTSTKYLYAIGETACNGVHGANRLASNSLLESLVFASRAAHDVIEQIDTIEWNHQKLDILQYPDKETRIKENRELLLQTLKEKDGEFYDKWCQHEGEH